MARPLKRDDEIDPTDRRILSVLRQEARLTNAELAERVGLSPSPCWARVKRLEAIGAITGYVATLDPKVLGVPGTVFIEVTLNQHDEAVLREFSAALTRMPEVMEAHLVTGDYDYLIKVAVAGAEDYEKFLREKLYRIPGIRHSRSTFALRALKQSVSIDPLLMG